MRQNDLGLRIANMLHGRKSRGRSLEGCVVGKANILGSVDENAASDEARILTGMPLCSNIAVRSSFKSGSLRLP